MARWKHMVTNLHGTGFGDARLTVEGAIEPAHVDKALSAGGSPVSGLLCTEMMLFAMPVFGQLQATWPWLPLGFPLGLGAVTANGEWGMGNGEWGRG